MNPAPTEGQIFCHLPGPRCLHRCRVHGLNPTFRKCGHFFGSAQGVHTIITTDGPRRHRAMRNAALPFFSSREMDYSFHKGRNHIQRAADSMVRKGQEGEPVDVHSYFQAIMVCFTFNILMMVVANWKHRQTLLQRLCLIVQDRWSVMIHLLRDGWLYTIPSVEIVGLVSGPRMAKSDIESIALI